jgi:HEAT repeat protein
MKVALVAFFLCWLVSPLNAQVAPVAAQDDPLIFDKRLSEWTKLLQDENPQTRWTAARNLGRIGWQANAALPALLAALKDNDDSVRKFAGWAVPRVRPQARDIPALVEAFEAGLGGTEIGGGIAEALGQIGPTAQEALPALKVRPGIWSAFAVVQIDPNDQTGVPQLVKLLDGFEDRHVLTRLAILRALGGIGPRARAALPVLSDMMQDKDQYLHLEVACAVAQINPDDHTAFDLLVAALADPRTSNDDVAARQFGFLGPQAKAAVPMLIRALQAADNRDNLKRECIADALGEIGPDARDALPILRDLLTHTSRRVRESAALAIYKIDRQ